MRGGGVVLVARKKHGKKSAYKGERRKKGIEASFIDYGKGRS